jgi:uncharacterized protein (DUF4415 family)
MKKKRGTVRYTVQEIKTMRREGADRTDYAKLEGMSAREIDAAAEQEGQFDWTRAQVGFPAPKRQLTLRLDGDVIDWFKEQGHGYQTRMNAVLRRFIEAQKNPHR